MWIEIKKKQHIGKNQNQMQWQFDGIISIKYDCINNGCTEMYQNGINDFIIREF